jgi:hypothetical protein
MAKSTGAAVFYIFLGGIIGGYIGVLLGLLIPAGLLHDILSTGFPIGLNQPIVLDLRLIVFTFGLKIFVNLFCVLGMIVGLYYSR